MEKNTVTTKTKWLVDHAHSSIEFKVRHLKIAHVKGFFKTFDATIFTTGKDFTTAEIELWIDVDSISTGDEKRDGHLKSADFFDAEKFKRITFTSSTIQNPNLTGNQIISGELTMKGITKSVKLDVEFGGIILDPYGNEKAGLTVSGKFKRSDWGLTWNAALESGGFMVGDDIHISCEIELSNAGEHELKLEMKSNIDENNFSL